MGTILRIGNRAAYIRRSAVTMAGTTRVLTTTVPVCAAWSKPQNVTLTARSDAGPSGQPGCQLLPSSVAVTRRLAQRNAGAAAVAGTLTCCVGTRAGERLAPIGVVGVLTGDVTVVDVVGAGDVASRALLAPLHALSALTVASVAKAVAIRCM
jgi:hypothetical protein